MGNTWCLNIDAYALKKVAEKQGNELATISVYLNTPIAAILLAVGFIGASVLFAGVMLLAK